MAAIPEEKELSLKLRYTRYLHLVAQAEVWGMAPEELGRKLIEDGLDEIGCTVVRRELGLLGLRGGE